MKYIKISIILVAVTLVSFCNAYSADVILDITSDYSIGDSSITFDLNLTTDTEIQVKGYQLSFDYDEGELSFHSYENLAKTLFPSDYKFYDHMFKNDPNEGELTFFAAMAQSYVAPNWETLSANTTTTLGTFTFDVADGAALNGDSDFLMLAPNFMGIKEGGVGISVHINPALEHMTDVGSPVPVPAAVWLLGSGLVGLAGIRRKTA